MVPQGTKVIINDLTDLQNGEKGKTATQCFMHDSGLPVVWVQLFNGIYKLLFISSLQVDKGFVRSL